MNQYSFIHEGFTIVIGWDEKLKTFFAEVAGIEYEEPIISLGQTAQEYSVFKLIMQKLDIRIKDFGLERFRITKEIAEKIMALKTEPEKEKAPKPQLSFGM